MQYSPHMNPWTPRLSQGSPWSLSWQTPLILCAALIGAEVFGITERQSLEISYRHLQVQSACLDSHGWILRHSFRSSLALEGSQSKLAEISADSVLCTRGQLRVATVQLTGQGLTGSKRSTRSLRCLRHFLAKLLQKHTATDSFRVLRGRLWLRTLRWHRPLQVVANSGGKDVTQATSYLLHRNTFIFPRLGEAPCCVAETLLNTEDNLGGFHHFTSKNNFDNNAFVCLKSKKNIFFDKSKRKLKFYFVWENGPPRTFL